MTAQASPVVLLHLGAGLLALLLGAVLLARPKGTAPHRAMGRAWVGLMLVVIVSSLWIPAFGQFSWIHLLTGLAAFGLASALLAIRQGRLHAHRAAMISTYLGLAGAFAGALAPGRLTGKLLGSLLGL
ncbi:MAG: hypothetical protein OHK0024_25240 [Thalassobaculales bacterium]